MFRRKEALFCSRGVDLSQSALPIGSGCAGDGGSFFSCCLGSALVFPGISAFFSGFLGMSLAALFFVFSVCLSFLTSWESPNVMGVKLYFGSHSTGRFLRVVSRK